jgi:hypothetical protein
VDNSAISHFIGISAADPTGKKPPKMPKICRQMPAFFVLSILSTIFPQVIHKLLTEGGSPSSYQQVIHNLSTITKSYPQFT